MSAPRVGAGAERAIAAVAIGTSAGGVDALITLLEAVPSGFPAAILVVMHIPARNDELLVEVLAPHCRLALQEAEDKAAIEAGKVYVAPPGYHLLVEPERSLALSVDAPVHFCRPSIDVLFESAAHAYRSELLGIVLTGANADGAQGLKAIRSAGGRAWVQRPGTAVADAMPKAALEQAGADRILTLSEMANELSQLGEPR